jgi:hypothetical protein
MGMKKLALFAAFIALVLLLILSLFNPTTVALPLFMLVFVLIYALATLLILIIIRWMNPKLSRTRLAFCACVLAFCPVALLALQSIGNLSFLDAVLSIALPAIIVWYALKKSAIG